MYLFHIIFVRGIIFTIYSHLYCIRCLGLLGLAEMLASISGGDKCFFTCFRGLCILDSCFLGALQLPW